MEHYKSAKVKMNRELAINNHWVVRDLFTGKFIESSRYRNDMIEKYDLEQCDFVHTYTWESANMKTSFQKAGKEYYFLFRHYECDGLEFLKHLVDARGLLKDNHHVSIAGVAILLQKQYPNIIQSLDDNGDFWKIHKKSFNKVIKRIVQKCNVKRSMA